MSTLAGTSTQFGNILTANATLRGISGGAGTLVVLGRSLSVAAQDWAGVVVGSGVPTDWRHALSLLGAGGNSANAQDDDGVSSTSQPTTRLYAANEWVLLASAWPGGAAAQRFHMKNLTSGIGWFHETSSGNNGGNRAAPGSAFLRVGFFSDFNGASFEVALVGVWVGVQLTDLQVEELGANLKTSDWWNCSGGQPTALVECNSATPSDIGASASPFNSIGTLALTGGDPPGWSFDGRGSVAPPAPVTVPGSGGQAGRGGLYGVA